LKKRCFCCLTAMLLALGAMCGCSADAENSSANTDKLEAAMTPLMAQYGLTATSSTAGGEDNPFEIHFIDVGQGEAALVLCDGYSMLIDGGGEETADKLTAYLAAHGITRLDYMAVTCPGPEHVSGLKAAFEYAGADTILSPITQHESSEFDGFLMALELKQAIITVPSPGYTFELGGATVEVLGPIQQYTEEADGSLIIKITYGETSFLFMGDAGHAAEVDLLYTGAELSSTVLKVGNHGSEDGTGRTFLQKVMPEYAVISAGAGNAQGWPSEEALSRLEDTGVITYRTDIDGTILCVSDGQQVQLYCQREDGSAAEAGEPAEDGEGAEIIPAGLEADIPIVEEETNDEPVMTGTYVGDAITGKIHRVSCYTLPAEEYRQYFNTRDEAVVAGFSSPCENCGA